MKQKWLGAVLVFAAAAGLILWRESRRPADVGAANPPVGARVVLFADLSEVDEVGGCGSIIRGVREATKRGIATEEIDARRSSDLPSRYRLLVAPTVLLLDAGGHEVRRFEGESPKTVEAIQEQLDTLAPAR